MVERLRTLLKLNSSIRTDVLLKCMNNKYLSNESKELTFVRSHFDNFPNHFAWLLLIQKKILLSERA